MSAKFFQLHKNDKKTGDNQPDYRISFKTEESFVEGGACWIKTDKSGKKFLSCKFGDPYKDHTDEAKSRKGWHIEEDEPLAPIKSAPKVQSEELDEF